MLTIGLHIEYESLSAQQLGEILLEVECCTRLLAQLPIRQIPGSKYSETLVDDFLEIASVHTGFSIQLRFAKKGGYFPKFKITNSGDVDIVVPKTYIAAALIFYALDSGAALVKDAQEIILNQLEIQDKLEALEESQQVDEGLEEFKERFCMLQEKLREPNIKYVKLIPTQSERKAKPL